MKLFFSKPILSTLILVALLVVGVYLAQLFIPSPPTPSIFPLPNSRFVSLNTPISLTFPSPLSASTRRHLAVTTTPTILDNSIWNQAGDTLILNPRESLAKNTRYSITIQFKDTELANFSFTTDPYDATDLRQQLQKQTEDDLVFGKKVNEFLEKRPWLSSLPVRTPTYYIYFDSPSQQFFIYFTSPQTPARVEQAITSLKQIGVAPADLKYKTFYDPSAP